jgi:hypothetical protein
LAGLTNTGKKNRAAAYSLTATCTPNPNLPSFGARVPGGILLPRQWIRRPLFAEPRGRGWYIADAENNEVSCAVYISKRAAVASIRAMPAVTADPPPLFYTVK